MRAVAPRLSSAHASWACFPPARVTSTTSPGSGEVVLVTRAGGKQAQLACALDSRGATARIELRVDTAHVRVDGVHREIQLARDVRSGEVRRQEPQHAQLGL